MVKIVLNDSPNAKRRLVKIPPTRKDYRSNGTTHQVLRHWQNLNIEKGRETNPCATDPRSCQLSIGWFRYANSPVCSQPFAENDDVDGFNHRNGPDVI